MTVLHTHKKKILDEKIKKSVFFSRCLFPFESHHEVVGHRVYFVCCLWKNTRYCLPKKATCILSTFRGVVCPSWWHCVLCPQFEGFNDGQEPHRIPVPSVSLTAFMSSAPKHFCIPLNAVSSHVLVTPSFRPFAVGTFIIKPARKASKAKHKPKNTKNHWLFPIPMLFQKLSTCCQSVVGQ